MKNGKLVRDLIPDIIRANGEIPTTETIINDIDYASELSRKLVEEANEFDEKPSLEELGDLLEVVDSLLVLHGWTQEELRSEQERKRLARGGF